MTQSVKVLCARCHLPIEWPAEPNAEDWVCCPRCGAGDRFEAIMAEVQDYICEMAAKGLSEMFDGTATRPDTISLRVNYQRSGRAWRFIADVEFQDSDFIVRQEDAREVAGYRLGESGPQEQAASRSARQEQDRRQSRPCGSHTGHRVCLDPDVDIRPGLLHAWALVAHLL